MIHEEALRSFRREVGDAFKAGTTVFPHYTLHGVEHLEELDRLALLLGGVIPNLSTERLNLLRLALILHDFAMVDVPSAAREEELRQGMTGDLTFADIVRQVHQDEIERVFTRPEWIARLSGLFPDEVPHGLEDACTIARHHRLHPLESAPDHVRDLCALMRILDELEIGNKRAPISAYEAMRSRMELISRLHWLKHICTRPVERHTTFSVEEKGQGRRILKAFVAVKATEGTWKGLQDKILFKLQECLEREHVNAILRSTLQIEIAVEPADSLSGVSPFLPAQIVQDLEDLPISLLSTRRSEPAETTVSSVALGMRSSAEVTLPPVPKPGRELRILAIPPEELPERLCTSGRLTLVGNTYVRPDEETAGGIAGAPNRIYVGPADSGKTRAAMEWILRLTGGVQSQWVVLRTEMGILPESTENIVLDSSYYEGSPPPKAILFLDDLPLNLPPVDAAFSAADAVSTLFRWFRELPYFRERRVVGTLRLEDVHSRPGWPDVLPTLGQNLELIRLVALDEDRYKQL